MGVENEQLTPEAERVLREIHDHCREPGIIDVTYWSKVFQEKSGAYVSRLRKLLKEFKDNDFLQIRCKRFINAWIPSPSIRTYN